MKLLVFVLMLVTYCRSDLYYDYIGRHLFISPEEQETVPAIAPTCLRETNVDPKFLKEIELGIPVTDRNAKCYLRCYFVNYGTMKETGEFALDILNEKLRGSEYKVAKYCEKLVNATEQCERAYQIYSCWIYNVYSAMNFVENCNLPV